jgi:hypothetical protein
MKKSGIFYGVWGRYLPAAVVAAMSAGIAVVSLAAEHPEHPKAGAAATKAVAESAGKLDGKVFVGELGEKGKLTGDKDEFIFKDGTFVSTACVEHGFKEAAYTAKDTEGAVEFVSEPVNDKSESMNWKGVVKDDQVTAKAIHKTGAGQTEYWFKGTLKPAKKAEHPEHPKK